MKAHFEEKHPVLLTKHVDLWRISEFEQTAMKKIWNQRRRQPVKRAKKGKLPPLVVSEKH
jgi:hypothetical protein